LLDVVRTHEQEQEIGAVGRHGALELGVELGDAPARPPLVIRVDAPRPGLEHADHVERRADGAEP
jgi:hypothetical protein